MRLQKLDGGRLFSPERIIFVARINSDATTKSIFRRFSKYGRVLSVDRCREKGYCTLLYEHEGSVPDAVHAENNTIFMDRNIDVRAGNKSRYFYRLPQNLDDLDCEDDRNIIDSAAHYRHSDTARFRREPRHSEYDRSLEEEYERYADVSQSDVTSSSSNAHQQTTSECVILTLKSPSVVYVKQVEQNVRDVGLSVHVNTPRYGVGVNKTLEEMKVAGVLFAVIVHSSNEQRRTVSLNILYTSTADEHRNIPLSELCELLNCRLQQRFEQHPQLPLPPAALAQLRLVMQGRPLTGLERDNIIRLLLIKRDYVKKQMSQSAVFGSRTAPTDITAAAGHESAVIAVTPAGQIKELAKLGDHISRNDDPASVMEMSPDTLELQQRILKIMVQLGLSEAA